MEWVLREQYDVGKHDSGVYMQAYIIEKLRGKYTN